MCNFRRSRAGQAVIIHIASALVDKTGNMPSSPGIIPNYAACFSRNAKKGQIMAMAHWGLPSPSFEAKYRNSDLSVTNIMNTRSPHCWLGIKHLCLVLFTSFSELDTTPDGKKPRPGIAYDNERPLAFFAGLWVPQ
jgi:putative SOS response-associated peptidase YedK